MTVHLRIAGKVACGCYKRWGSCQLTSVRTIRAVTCRNCLRMLAAALPSSPADQEQKKP